jgi:hypothetical protein
MSTIEIHEFSTGINVQGTPDNWWSVGFSGGYMNSTLTSIPKVVQQDIAADLFYLSEFAVQKKPAIIGREVKLGEEEWSVLAVITHAKDESDRGISVSRYFLTEGLGKLNDLLTYQQLNSLTFNPFDKKRGGDKVSYNTNQTINDNLLHILDNHEELIKNILVPSTTTTKAGTRIPSKVIHQLAEKKAKEFNQLVSWAYDVEGLKKPHDFLIIYPAAATTPPALPPSNNNVDQNIQKLLGKHPISQFIDKEKENDVKVAVKELINQSSFTKKNFQIIEEALIDSQFTDDVWNNSIFAILDINQITNDSSYPPIYLRVYLLYSLIFSKRLPDFLTWLNRKKIGSEAYTLIQEFSRNLQNNLSQLRKNQQKLTIDNHLKQGVNYLIFHLIQHPELLESVVWLVTDKKGLWGGAYQEFINNLWADIKQIARNYKTAKTKLDEDIKQKTGSRYSITYPADIKNALKGNSYELTYASENLTIFNQKEWQEIKDYFIDLIWYKDGKSTKNERFLPLADLLYTITQNKPKNAQFNVETDYRLPAIFYQISTGDVPNSLWKECQFSRNNKATIIQIIHENKSLIDLKRRLNKLEKTTRIILNTAYEIPELLTASVSIPIWALICACPLLVLGGFGLGKWTNSDVSIVPPPPSPSPSVSPSPSPSPSPATSWKATVTAIDTLRDEFVKIGQDKLDVEAAIIKNIAVGFPYAYKADNQDAWTPKIKKFQKENSITETGFISQSDETYKALKCKVAEELNLTDQVPDCPANFN